MANDPPQRRGLVGSVVGLVAPAVMRQIDANDLVEAIDVNVIAEQLDLDALVERLDVNAIASDLDLDALVERLDVNAIAADLDLEALVERLDVNAIAARIDLDRLVERLDVNAIAGRIDLDALVQRVDVNEVAKRIDVAQFTAGATQDVAVSGLDLVRRQLVRADATVDGLVDRLVRRTGDDRPDAPGDLGRPPTVEHIDAEPPRVGLEPGELQRRDVSGHYAGPVTRLLAVTGDIGLMFATQAALAWAVFSFFGVALDTDVPFGTNRWVGLAFQFALFVLWFWVPVALFGRTIAMGVLGLAVVARDGGVVTSGHALTRAIVVPLSVLIPLAFVGLFVGKERRSLHDVAAGTVVVYDWGDRDAEQPVTIREQFSARVRRRRLAQT